MSADLLWLPPADPAMTRLDGSVWLTQRANGDLDPIHLADMTAEHRCHVLHWLRRNAALMQAHERRWISSLHKRRLLDLAQFARRLDYIDATAPEVWIEETPLVCELHALIRRDRRRPLR